MTNTPLLKDYLRGIGLNSNKSQPYRRKWITIAEKVELFEKHVGFEIVLDSFNYRTVEMFADWLRFSPKKYKADTVAKCLSLIKQALRRATRDGISVKWDIEDYKVQRDTPFAISLTEEEIERIFNLNIKHHGTHAVRERFIIGCCTGFRLSDVRNISLDNVSGGVISRKTQKTGETVQVPIHWMVSEILKRNNGEFPVVPTSQSFNKTIKVICKKAGITEKVLYEQVHGTKVVRKLKPKYEFVSSHTARRSFATNAYLAGIPPARIMLITGHTTETAFFKYIRIQKVENARVLSQHKFFNR